MANIRDLKALVSKAERIEETDPRGALVRYEEAERKILWDLYRNWGLTVSEIGDGSGVLGLYKRLYERIMDGYRRLSTRKT